MMVIATPIGMIPCVVLVLGGCSGKRYIGVRKRWYHGVKCINVGVWNLWLTSYLKSRGIIPYFELKMVVFHLKLPCRCGLVQRCYDSIGITHVAYGMTCGYDG